LRLQFADVIKRLLHAAADVGRYSVESLNGDVAAIRGKIKAVKDQLPFCKDDAFNAGIAAFLQACP